MNAGIWSGVVTTALLVLFIYGCFWVYSKQRTKDFEEAAQLALDEPPLENDTMKGGQP